MLLGVFALVVHRGKHRAAEHFAAARAASAPETFSAMECTRCQPSRAPAIPTEPLNHEYPTSVPRRRREAAIMHNARMETNSTPRRADPQGF